MNSAGIPLHHHRAVAEMWKQSSRHVGIVLEQVSLGVAELRPEHLSQIRQLHFLAADLESAILRRRDFYARGDRLRRRHWARTFGARRPRRIAPATGSYLNSTSRRTA